MQQAPSFSMTTAPTMHLSGWAANYAPGKNFFAQPSPFSVAIDDTRYALLEASSGGEQVYISRGYNAAGCSDVQTATGDSIWHGGPSLSAAGSGPRHR